MVSAGFRTYCHLGSHRPQVSVYVGLFQVILLVRLDMLPTPREKEVMSEEEDSGSGDRLLIGCQVGESMIWVPSSVQRP